MLVSGAATGYNLSQTAGRLTTNRLRSVSNTASYSISGTNIYGDDIQSSGGTFTGTLKSANDITATYTPTGGGTNTVTFNHNIAGLTTASHALVTPENDATLAGGAWSATVTATQVTIKHANAVTGTLQYFIKFIP
jgi:hypothetical protein